MAGSMVFAMVSCATLPCASLPKRSWRTATQRRAQSSRVGTAHRTPATGAVGSAYPTFLGPRLCLEPHCREALFRFAYQIVHTLRRPSRREPDVSGFNVGL